MNVCVTQLCPTLCDPMDCISPGPAVHGILQARILEWVAILLDLPDPGIEPRSPALHADALPSELQMWRLPKSGICSLSEIKVTRPGCPERLWGGPFLALLASGSSESSLGSRLCLSHHRAFLSVGLCPLLSEGHIAGFRMHLIIPGTPSGDL